MGALETAICGIEPPCWTLKQSEDFTAFWGILKFASKMNAAAVAGIVIPTVMVIIGAIALFIARMMWTGALHVYKKVDAHSLDDEEMAFKSVLEQGIDMDLEPFQFDDTDINDLVENAGDAMCEFDREELEQLQLLEEYQGNLIDA